jgi:hypothetical protein
MGAIGMNLFQQFLENGPKAFSAFADGAGGKKRGND